MLCKILAFFILPYMVVSQMESKPVFKDLNGYPEPMDPNFPGLEDLAIISDLDGASRLEANTLELRQSQGCNDNYPASSQCPYWANVGYCSQSYVQWMAQNCKKSCNLCGNSCNDNYPASSQCPSWASWACNSAQYGTWMASNCQKSCNLCGGSGGSNCKGSTADWNCCTSSSPCKEEEGDCDTDSDCESGLACGTNNCPSDFPSSGYDCCYKPSGQSCSNIPSWINLNAKIINGQFADSPIPWQVHIHISITGVGSFVCGGTILDEETILSAAHCFVYEGATAFPMDSGDRIEAGITQEGSSGQQSILIKDVINHPQYDSVTFNNDISIVKLKTPLTFNNNVKSACLPEASFVPQSQAVVSGWGRTIDGDPSSGSSWLKYVVVPFISNARCVAPYTNYPSNAVTSNMVCAGYLSGGKDSCQGDSGGPLVVPKSSSDDTAIIYGVVSWGWGCAQAKQPGVYTRVTNYLAWIKANMK